MIKVLDKGAVELIDHMGNDESICRSARVSYGQGTKTTSDDETLIRYMLRNRHTSPFESVIFTFYVKAPIFVIRQWHRHRTFCLGPDTTIDFVRPCDDKRYPLSIKYVADVFSKRRMQSNARKYKIDTAGIKQIDPSKEYNTTEIATMLKTRAAYVQQWCTRYKLKSSKVKTSYGFRYIITGENLINWLAESRQSAVHNKILNMRLRCLNENTKEISHTKIVDAWENPPTQLYTLTTKCGNTIEASADHLFYTSAGWLKLRDFYDVEASRLKLTDVKLCMIKPNRSTVDSFPLQFNKEQLAKERWCFIKGHENRYEISSLGRVRSHCLSKLRILKSTIMATGYPVVGLTKNGKTKPYTVHRLVAQHFIKRTRGNNTVCHIDGNKFNNVMTNLYWGSDKSNAEDRKRHGNDAYTKADFVSINDVAPSRITSSYDIQVEGPYHNFSANGFIIHNSYNEVSARYSELKDEYYVPDVERIKKQSETNKQGSGSSFDEEDQKRIVNEMTVQSEHEFKHYNKLLDQNVARELARINLPLNTYTEMYTTVNLHNLFHFLKLRLDSHAQWEIQEYAKGLLQLIEPIVPASVRAFNHYVLNSRSFSQYEWKLFTEIMDNSTRDYLKRRVEDYIDLGLLSKREGSEFLQKLIKEN